MNEAMIVITLSSCFVGLVVFAALLLMFGLNSNLELKNYHIVLAISGGLIAGGAIYAVGFNYDVFQTDLNQFCIDKGYEKAKDALTLETIDNVRYVICIDKSIIDGELVETSKYYPFKETP
jgi:hypothetical protein